MNTENETENNMENVVKEETDIIPGYRSLEDFTKVNYKLFKTLVCC